MRAIVVYESLYGNTAEVARAVAAGIGSGTEALSTAEASPEAVAGADLLVAGAPAHMHGLPSDKTRATAVERGDQGAAPVPDLSHPTMRSWLDDLPERKAAAAAFDTRADGWWGGGAAQKIGKALKKKRYRLVDEVQGFIVDDDGGPFLRDGEIERARAWGERLAGLDT